MTTTTLRRIPHLRTKARQINLTHLRHQILKRDFVIGFLWRGPDPEFRRGFEERAEEDGVAGEAVRFVARGGAAR